MSGVLAATPGPDSDSNGDGRRSHNKCNDHHQPFQRTLGGMIDRAGFFSSLLNSMVGLRK